MPRKKWINPSGAPTYISWQAMMQRCCRPGHPAYWNYGGRGICVCERWLSYDAFFEDMGERPPGMQIDRIDTDGNYEPGNCRWVSARQNLNNRKNTAWVNGMPLTVAAETFGIKACTLSRRVRLGVEPERLLMPKLRAPAPAEHGTRKAYERDGCRCDLCRAFNAERGRQFRAKQAVMRGREPQSDA